MFLDDDANAARERSKDAPGARKDYWIVQDNNLARWTVETS